MSPIKDFKLVLWSQNEGGVFTEGDEIAGTVSFNLKSDTKVKSVSVKAKGDANVHWSEGTGDNRKSYDSHKRYFKLKEYLVGKNSQGTVLPQGNHDFKFTFRLPQITMPSSFRGAHGKIVYLVEAKISRSWRWPSEKSTEVTFVSKSFPAIAPSMCPQSGSVNKELGTFSKGNVEMSASVNRGVCSPGDTLSAFAKVSNRSSKSMKPKFSLQQKTVFRAEGKTNSSDKTLFKMVGETIEAESEITVSCEVKVPEDVMFSLLNCEIISVEYYIKVYLDISFSFDPEVVFPLIIVPSWLVAAHLTENVAPHQPWPVGAPSNSDFPPATFPPGPFPPPALPPSANHPPALAPNTFPPPAFPPSANPPPSNFPPPAFPPAANPPPSNVPPPAFPPSANTPPSSFPPPAFPPSANTPPSSFPPPTFLPPANPDPNFSPNTFPPHTNPAGPQPVPSDPAQYPVPFLTHPTTIASGNQNQWPQTPLSTGFSSSSPAKDAGPTAPPLFTSEEDPPSYTSLFLTSNDPLGRSDQQS